MDKKTLDSYIRVNHAGEFGAVRIYQGQIDALGDNPIIQEMLSQEKEHLSAFEEEMRARKIRPTAFLPLWSALGYGLGFISGKIGKSAAMACTQAVEEIIDEHYLMQLKTLSQEENLLKEKFQNFEMTKFIIKILLLIKVQKMHPFIRCLQQVSGLRRYFLLVSRRKYN